MAERIVGGGTNAYLVSLTDDFIKHLSFKLLNPSRTFYREVGSLLLVQTKKICLSGGTQPVNFSHTGGAAGMPPDPKK